MGSLKKCYYFALILMVPTIVGSLVFIKSGCSKYPCSFETQNQTCLMYVSPWYNCTYKSPCAVSGNFTCDLRQMSCLKEPPTGCVNPHAVGTLVASIIILIMFTSCCYYVEKNLVVSDDHYEKWEP